MVIVKSIPRERKEQVQTSEEGEHLVWSWNSKTAGMAGMSDHRGVESGADCRDL